MIIILPVLFMSNVVRVKNKQTSLYAQNKMVNFEMLLQEHILCIPEECVLQRSVH
jgi:hypothetical protein